MKIEINEDRLRELAAIYCSLDREADEAFGEIDNKYDDENIAIHTLASGIVSGTLDGIALVLREDNFKIFMEYVSEEIEAQDSIEDGDNTGNIAEVTAGV